MTSRRKDVLLALGSLILTFLGAEAGARRFLPHTYRVNPAADLLGQVYRADPLIGWVMSTEPTQFRHRLIDQSNGSVAYDVVYNMARGQRVTAAQPLDGPDLVAAGCSFTFGQGLKDEDTWPSLLQERLKAYRVVNLGAMGYGTDQALMAAERYAQLSPQTSAVVLGFGDFQIERNRSAQGWMVDVYPFSKPLFAIDSDGAAYKRQVRTWSFGMLSAHSDLFAHLGNTLANLVYGIPSHEQATELTVALITTFAQRFKARGVRFAVVVLPWSDDQATQARADRKLVVERLRTVHVPVLELDLPRLSGGKFDVQKFSIATIDKHPNHRYNAALADQLQGFLLSSGIIRE